MRDPEILYTQDVQEALVNLLIALAPGAPGKRNPVKLRQIVEAFPPKERPHMVMEKLIRLQRLALQEEREEDGCPDCGIGQTLPHSQHPLSAKDRLAQSEQAGERWKKAREVYEKALPEGPLWTDLSTTIKRTWFEWVAASDDLLAQDAAQDAAESATEALAPQTSAIGEKVRQEAAEEASDPFRYTSPQEFDVGEGNRLDRWHRAQHLAEAEGKQWALLAPIERKEWYRKAGPAPVELGMAAQANLSGGVDRSLRASDLYPPPVTKVTDQPVDYTVYPYDEHAHARIDALQRETAYMLGKIIDNGQNVADDFASILGTFKEADERTRKAVGRERHDRRVKKPAETFNGPADE